MAKNGKTYENVILQDKTGTIDAKYGIPILPGSMSLKPWTMLDITGEVTSFQGTLQLNIKRARKAEEGEYQPSDYLPVSEKNVDEMYRELMALLGKLYVYLLENPFLKQLIQKYFGDEKFERAFKNHSAAKTVHHSFVGGLLEHTLSVVNLCAYYTERYPYLNRDLLFTAAAFHDVGKLKELSNFPENDYTDDGQLLGHIVMGSELVGTGAAASRASPSGWPANCSTASCPTTGKLEYGSPRSRPCRRLWP